MAEPTLWSKDPHTNAKHRILEEYLKAWFLIISKSNKNVIYIDGFAGPGEYEEGKIGSPIIALNCLVNHSQDLCKRQTDFIFLFIESDVKRANNLERVISRAIPDIPENVTISVRHGKFAPTMRILLDIIERNGNNLDPTFAFIDPFGYGGLPFSLIQEILAFRSCEVFINFAYGSINRFIETTDSRQQVFDEFFGTDEWQEIRGIKDPEIRNQMLTTLYTRQLKKCARYVRSLEMINDSNNISYHLYFASNHIKGFEQMKTAMWRVDPRGSFRFADTTDAGTRFLLLFEEAEKYQDQAETILSRFKGQTVNISVVRNFCVEETRFPYLWKKSLKILEDNHKLIVQSDRKRKGTYPDGCRLQFDS